MPTEESMSDSDTTVPLNHETEASSPRNLDDEQVPSPTAPNDESKAMEANGFSVKAEVEDEEQVVQDEGKIASDQETESVAPRSPSPDRAISPVATGDIEIKPSSVDVENPATTLAVMTKSELSPKLIEDVNEAPRSAEKHVAAEDTGTIRCICGIDDDDGFTICCDRCLIWQHGECVTIYTRQQLEKNDSLLPEMYLCDRCNPRDFDIERAVRLQKERIASESRPTTKGRKAGKSRSNNSHNSPASISGNTPRDDNGDSAPRKSSSTGKNDGKRPRMTPKASSESTTVLKQQHTPSVNEALESEYKVEYMPISECEALTFDNVDNVRLCAEIAHNISREGRHASLPTPLTLTDTVADAIRQMKTFPPRTIPKVAVHRVQHLSERISYRGPKFELHAAQEYRTDDFIIEYVGQLSSVWDYKNDPINQYQRTGHVKRHVLFSPLSEVDLCIDARRKGNEARYIRGSCKPNAALSIVTTLKPGIVRFGLFASSPIADGAEITVAHFTNLSDCKQFTEAMEESQKLIPLSDKLQAYAEIAHGILSCNGCGCGGVGCKLATLALRSSNPIPTTPATSINEKPDGSEDVSCHRQQSREPSESNRDTTPGSEDLNENMSREERKNRAAVAQFERSELVTKGITSARKISAKRESPSHLLQARKRKRSKSITETADLLNSPPAQTLDQVASRSPTPGLLTSSDKPASGHDLSPSDVNAESPGLEAVPMEIISRLKRKATQDDGYIHPKRMLLARYLSDHAQKAAQASVIHKTDAGFADKHGVQADLHISMPPPLFTQEDPTQTSAISANTPGVLSTPGAVLPSPLDVSLASPITPSMRTKKLSLSEYRARYKKENSQPPTPQANPPPPAFNTLTPDVDQTAAPHSNGVPTNIERNSVLPNTTANPPSPMEPATAPSAG